MKFRRTTLSEYAGHLSVVLHALPRAEQPTQPILNFVDVGNYLKLTESYIHKHGVLACDGAELELLLDPKHHGKCMHTDLPHYLNPLTRAGGAPHSRDLWWRPVLALC